VSRRRKKAARPEQAHVSTVAAPNELSTRVRTALLALLIVVATMFAYQQAWNAGYIWDDDVYVINNELLCAPDGLWRIWFSRDSPSQYFPLTYTSFRLEYALWGLQPAGYHWVNIFLHAANALLVWRLLHLLRVPGAWLAAAVFALHPVHVESVAWITERKNTLMGLFFLLSLIAWVRFVADETRRRWQWYGLSLGAYLLSLFAKTTACTMPAAVLLVLWLQRRPITRARWLQVTPYVLLGLIMGLVTIWWERHHQGTQGELFAIGPVERVLVASRAVWFYLSKLVWPQELAFSYPRWDISAGDPADYLWVLLCFAAAGAVWWLRRRLGRGPEVGLVFFVATLSPMLGFIMLYTFRYTFVADHYNYISSIGPIALVAAGISIGVARLAERQRGLASVLVAAAILLPLALKTWRQAGIYQNEETLWRATIEVNPSSWMAHTNLAIQLVARGEVAEAIPLYEQALRLNPDYAEAHHNLGNALVRLGRAEESVEHFRRAVELFPQFAAAQANLGAVLLQLGRTSAAVAELQKAVQLNPNAAAAHYSLGEALSELRRNDEALQHFTRAAELQPHDPEPHFKAGNTLLQARRFSDAVSHYERTLQLRPDYPAAHNNLGIALLELDRASEALEQFRSAVRLNPQYASAYHNMAAALRRLGRHDEALEQLQRAWEAERPK
jgi:protein O-mannosyl-transferase